MIVALSFDLDEEVTPDLFASKVALACAKGGALRPGEAVVLGTGVRLVVSGNAGRGDETVGVFE